MNKSFEKYDLLNGSIILFHKPSFAFLKKISLKYCDTVVTLQWQSEHPHEVSNSCNKLNLSWIWCPIKAINYNLLQNAELFRKLFEQLLNTKELLIEKQKILIHCAAGIHRTGFFSYILLRLCDHTHHETIQVFQIIRPEILEKIGKHRLEIAEKFYEKMIGNEVFIPHFDSLGMIETDFIKESLNPLLWIKVLFNQNIAKISFCITSGDLEKMIVGLEIFLHCDKEFVWKHQRSENFTNFDLIRTVDDCEDVLRGFVFASTKLMTTKIAGTSCFFDKEFLYCYMPKVLETTHYRIVDLSTFCEIRNTPCQQTYSIYEDINKFKELKNIYN